MWSSKMARRCWSDLPLELLCVLLRHLSFRDFIRSGAVCRSWRSAVKQNHLPPLPQHPWFLLQNGSFFAPTEKILFRFGGVSGDQCCIGSSYGWLVIMDDKLEIFLLDPLTNARHQLPSFAKTPGVDHDTHLSVEKAFLVSGDHHDSSAGRYTVIITHGDYNNLAFVRPGDETWTLLDKELSGIRDVVYHGGLFYAIDISGRVWGWDFTGDTPLLVKDLGWEEDHLYVIQSVYFVQTSGDLLRLVHVGAGVEGFVVFKLDQNQLNWVEVDGLGDASLLMCFGGSMSFSTQEFPDLKGNCRADANFYRDLMVYNVQDESVWTCCSNVARVNWPPEISNDA